MRRTAALVLLTAAAAAACARPSTPPGGPELNTPPKLLATRPDTMAKVPGFTGPAVFVFDVPISEVGLLDAINVSPRTSAVDVSHRGDEVRVALARGWQPGRVYQVTMDRTVKDRFGNALATPLAIVFSTGPEIPTTAISGAATERITGKPVVGGRAEAISLPDSLVYSTRTDSAGGFTLRYLPAGSYRVRVFSDANKDRALQSYEARDTARVTLAATGTPAPLRLSVLPQDTSAPKPGGARGAERIVTVTFDDYLDPAQRLTPSQVRIIGPDSAALAVAEVRVGTIDTATAAAGDSAAARRPRTDSARANAGRDSTAARDTVHLPSQTLTVRLSGVLPAQTDFRVVVSSVRNVNGLVGGGETRFRTPAPPRGQPAARDSSRGTPPAGTAPGRPAPEPRPGTPPPTTPPPADAPRRPRE